jgi:hypothetical protein
MKCAGSPALESVVPDTSSVYADEGTAAHTLASAVLTEGGPAAARLGATIRVGEREFEVTKEMAGHVQSFVDYVLDMAEGNILLVDQQVPIGHLTGEAGATGTADVVILAPRLREIVVIDFKYGMGVKVFAAENPQIRHYGLGALEKYSLVADFETAGLIIHQPRLGHVDAEALRVRDLLAYGEEIGSAADEAHEALALFAAGAVPDEMTGYLNPGEEQCRFCRAKADCPALRAEVIDVAAGLPATAADFAEFFPIVPDADLPPNYLAVSMDKVDLVEGWCKAVRAEVERRLLVGQDVPGYKLVTGKMGDRKWTDPAEVEAKMRQAKMRVCDIYDQKLISPTTAEKHLKTSPKTWAYFQQYITRAPGKPSVAPATDPRPALAVTDVVEEFRALT